jgi:outer membrane protein insertion porin family
LIFFFFTVLVFNVTVSKVEFKGNKTVPGRTLRDQILTRKGDEYSELHLTYDINGITKYYETQGFFHTEVSPIVTSKDKGMLITYSIQEGIRQQVEIMVINGTTRDTLEDLLQIQEGDYFIKSYIRSSEDSIEAYFKDRGFPFASVSSFVMADSGILMFNVNRGMKYYTREITIKGLTSCNPRVIQREIEMERGDLFTRKTLIRSQQNIYGLGFFSSVDVELNRYGNDSLDLIFNVRELKSRIMNFGIGLSTPLNFLFSFGIEELNLFNIGHRFQIRPSFQINIDREWSAKLDGRYTIPHITDVRLTLSILPFIWYEHLQDYDLHTRGNELRVSKVLTEDILLNVSNRYKYVELHRKTESQLNDSLTGITNSITAQVLIDSRDDFFNPLNGWYITPLIEFAGGLFGGVNDFLRYECEGRFFFPLLGNTIAQRLRIGYMYPLNGVAFYEIYSLGGQYTVRGYPEKSIGPLAIGDEHYGENLANYNFECRLHLPLNFGMVGFFDCGYISNEFNLEQIESFKMGAGVGLRYYTPIGPARFDIGFPFDRNHETALYFGIYHIF